MCSSPPCRKPAVTSRHHCPNANARFHFAPHLTKVGPLRLSNPLLSLPDCLASLLACDAKVSHCFQRPAPVGGSPDPRATPCRAQESQVAHSGTAGGRAGSWLLAPDTIMISDGKNRTGIAAGYCGRWPQRL